jgi:transposase-like protein
MGEAAMVCPGCGLAGTRKSGGDRQGRQIRLCRGCGRRFAMRSATPFSGYRFPPDGIVLAVRW